MNSVPPESSGFFSISIEQQKLLANALRIQILHTLADSPKTAKQVADLLDRSPGNIHYHIQRLYEGKLVELVETREVGGIVEKYYKAVHTRFRPEAPPVPNSSRVWTQLLLTAEEKEQLIMELVQLLEKWERRLPGDKRDDRQETAVSITLQEVNTSAEEEE